MGCFVNGKMGKIILDASRMRLLSYDPLIIIGLSKNIDITVFYSGNYWKKGRIMNF